EQVVGWVEPRFLAALAHRNRWGTRWASRRDPAFDPPYQGCLYTLSRPCSDFAPGTRDSRDRRLDQLVPRGGFGLLSSPAPIFHSLSCWLKRARNSRTLPSCQHAAKNRPSGEKARALSWHGRPSRVNSSCLETGSHR